MSFGTRGAPSPQPPWHMWGTTLTLTAARGIAPLPGGIHGVSGVEQVCRVNYRRPETWSFFAAAEILAGNISDVQMDIFAELHLSTGVGRSQFSTGGQMTQDVPAGYPAYVPWIRFVFSIAAGVTPGMNINRRKWTCRSQTPLVNDLVATSAEPLDWIVGQDIQVSGQVGLGLAAASMVANSITVGLSCYLAPRAHIRPDWFLDSAEALSFAGAETGGT